MCRHLCPTILVFLALLAGCRTNDPFGETDYANAHPTSPYPSCPLPVAAACPPQERGALDGATLSLAECITTALERNPQTRVAWQAARSQAFQVGQQRSALLPQMNLAAGALHNATIRDRDKGQAPRNQVNTLFGVRYLLLDGGLRDARIRSAEGQLLTANFLHNTALQDVALAVELAYHQRLAAESLVRVAEENLRRSDYNLKLAQARLKSGVAARFDVLTAETERANADLALVRARNLQRVTQGSLARAMGVHVAERFEIQNLPPDRHEREREDIERLLQEAQRARPELKAALAAIQARQADIDVIGSEYFPQVSANADYGVRDDTFFAGGEEWNVLLTFDLPLFTGFSRGYRRSQAQSDYQQAIAQYQDTSQAVALEVWIAHSRLIEAGEAIEAADALVASANESLRVAQGRYRAGAGNIIELVTAQAAQTDANTQHVRAVLDWYIAMAQLQRTIGHTLAGLHRDVPTETIQPGRFQPRPPDQPLPVPSAIVE